MKVQGVMREEVLVAPWVRGRGEMAWGLEHGPLLLLVMVVVMIGREVLPVQAGQPQGHELYVTWWTCTAEGQVGCLRQA
jgi:hypothetical protein